VASKYVIELSEKWFAQKVVLLAAEGETNAESLADWM
jgi:hypothetical protein